MLFSPGKQGLRVRRQGRRTGDATSIVPTAGYVNQAKRRGIGGETNFRGEADSGYDEKEKYRTQAEEP